jgi:hypothetical protein
MDTRLLTAKIEGALERQLLVSGGQPEVESAATALLAVLGPALRDAVLELAGQAAAEVTAQLPGGEVEVVVVDGDPELRVRSADDQDPQVGAGEPLDARITLRLSPLLKERVETAAGELGESVNAWLVRSLGGLTAHRSRKPGTKISGRIQT